MKDVIYMVSTDRDILLDIKAEQVKQRQEFSEFKAVVLKRLDNVEYEQRLLHSKIDSLQTSVYWVLGVITLFLTALGMIGIAATIITAFRKSERSQPDSKTFIDSLAEAFTKGVTAGRREAQ